MPTVAPAGSAATSICSVPAMTDIGRSDGAGPISQMKSASRSTPTPVSADPTSTGNSMQSSTSWASVRSNSAAVGTSPDRYRSSWSSSPDTISSTSSSCTRCSSSAISLGIGAEWCRPSLSYSNAWSDSTSATPCSDSSSPSGSSSAAKPWPHFALQRSEHVVEVGSWLVVFVDEHESGDLVGDAPLPGQFGADLDAVDSADHDDRQVGDAHGRLFFTDEVGVARRVEQIDLVRSRHRWPATRTGRRRATTTCRV